VARFTPEVPAGTSIKASCLLPKSGPANDWLPVFVSDYNGRFSGARDLSAEAMREALHGTNMPAWQADGLIEDYAHYGRGEAAVVATGVQDATGSPSRPFVGFARDHVFALS